MAEVIRKARISEQTFYRWKAKYAGLEVVQVRQMPLRRSSYLRTAQCRFSCVGPTSLAYTPSEEIQSSWSCIDSYKIGYTVQPMPKDSSMSR
jgi:hypothetical protein